MTPRLPSPIVTSRRTLFRSPRPAVAALTVSLIVSLLATMPVEATETPAPDFESVALLDELTSDHATLFRLYQAFFGRDPDVAGALYWIELLDRCTSLNKIAQEFAGSQEFIERYGALDDAAFVELTYGNVLGRASDPGGHHYWTGKIRGGELSRGGVMLHVSLSDEFRSLHQYPSDEVPARPCRLPGGVPTARSITLLPIGPLATVPDAGGLVIANPAVALEMAGFHQSSHPGALAMAAVGGVGLESSVMDSRNRGTVATGAIDIAVHPLVSIHAPVSGSVVRAGEYLLYCTYGDGFVVINPDDRPDLEVKVLHVQDVAVSPGDRVEVGDRIAGYASVFPFRSQVDDLTAEPSWPHVHIEVVDPSVPRNRSSGSC